MVRNLLHFSLLTMSMLSACKIEIINPSVKVDEGAVTIEEGFEEPVEEATGKPLGVTVSDSEGNFIGRRVSDISPGGDFTLVFPGGGEVVLNINSETIKSVDRKDLLLQFTGPKCHLGLLNAGEVLSTSPITKSAFVMMVEENKTSLFLVITKSETTLPPVVSVLKDGDEKGLYTCFDASATTQPPEAAPTSPLEAPPSGGAVKAYQVGTMRLNFPYPLKVPLNAGG